MYLHAGCCLTSLFRADLASKWSEIDCHVCLSRALSSQPKWRGAGTATPPDQKNTKKSM